MKKTLFKIFIIALIIFMYLNRSYAHIYNEIDNAALQSPPIAASYEMGDSQKKPFVYVAIGDSLTAGVGVNAYKDSYPYRLTQKLLSKEKRITLKTFAMPGVRSSGALTFFNDAVKAKPDMVTILIGVNDIHGNISKQDFKNNYEEILKKLTTQTRAKIYIINIPYIGDSKLILPPYSYYFNYQTKQFNLILKELSEAYHTEYVDLYDQTLPNVQETGYYSADSFHPSIGGYALWAQKIYESFNQ